MKNKLQALSSLNAALGALIGFISGSSLAMDKNDSSLVVLQVVNFIILVLLLLNMVTIGKLTKDIKE